MRGVNVVLMKYVYVSSFSSVLALFDRCLKFDDKIGSNKCLDKCKE